MMVHNAERRRRASLSKLPGMSWDWRIGCAENRFFEGTACASEIRSALLTDEDEITGDDSRQLADLENKKGCVVVDDGNPIGLGAHNF